MDDTGRVTSWNQQAESIFGWVEREGPGAAARRHHRAQAHRAAHASGLRRFLATGEGPILNQRIELTALKRDGTEFPVELAVAPVRVGSSWVFSAFVRDITARRARTRPCACPNRSSAPPFRRTLRRWPSRGWPTPAGRCERSLLRLFGMNRQRRSDAAAMSWAIWRRDEQREQMLAQLRAGGVSATSRWSG